MIRGDPARRYCADELLAAYVRFGGFLCEIRRYWGCVVSPRRQTTEGLVVVTDFSFQIVAVVFAVVFGVIVWVLVSTSAKRRRQAPINTQQVQWQAQGELLQRTNGTGAFTVTRGNIVVIFLYVMAVFALGMGGRSRTSWFSMVAL